jgi:hypothetical protein
MHRQDAGGAHIVDHCQQNVRAAAALLRGTSPGVINDIWSHTRVAIQRAGSRWVRRHEPLVAFGVGGRGAPSIFHITAADPTCARRNTNLSPIIIYAAHDGAHGVGAVTVVVAGNRTVVTAVVQIQKAQILMDGIMPGIGVVSLEPIPAAVLALDGRVIPLVAGVLPANDHPLPGIAGCPYLGSADFLNIPQNAAQFLLSCGFLRRHRIDLRVGVNAGNLLALSQVLDQLQVTLGPDHIGNPVGTVGDVPALQFFQEGGLRPPGSLGQCLEHKGAFLLFGHQGGGLVEIGLFSQVDQKFNLTIWSGLNRLQDPLIHFVLPGGSRSRRDRA